MPNLYKAIRTPGNKSSFCVWFTGDIKDIPEHKKQGARHTWRIVREEYSAKDAIFWAQSFNANGGYKT